MPCPSPVPGPSASGSDAGDRWMPDGPASGCACRQCARGLKGVALTDKTKARSRPWCATAAARSGFRAPRDYERQERIAVTGTCDIKFVLGGVTAARSRNGVEEHLS
jgi:hypothetical protein